MSTLPYLVQSEMKANMIGNVDLHRCKSASRVYNEAVLRRDGAVLGSDDTWSHPVEADGWVTIRRITLGEFVAALLGRAECCVERAHIMVGGKPDAVAAWYRATDPEAMLLLLTSMGLITQAQADKAREPYLADSHPWTVPYPYAVFYKARRMAADRVLRETYPEVAEAVLWWCEWTDWSGHARAEAEVLRWHPEISRDVAHRATYAAYAAYGKVLGEQLSAVRSLVTPQQLLSAIHMPA